MLVPLLQRIRPRHLVAAALAYTPLAVIMFGPLPGSLAAVADRCGGLRPFDVRPGWNAADARTLVRACGRAGRTAYLHQQLVDLAYPLVLAALLLAATGLLARSHGRRAWLWLLPTVAMTVLDYLENSGIWLLLMRWPHVDANVATLAGGATAVKRVLGFVAFTVPLLLLAIEGVRRRRRNPGPGPRATALADCHSIAGSSMGIGADAGTLRR